MIRSRDAIGRAALRVALCSSLIACGSATTVPSPAPSPQASVAPAATAPIASVAAASPPAPAPSPTPASPTVAAINALRVRLTADPNDALALRDLGLELLQRVRETADPSLYGKADEALARARALLPADAKVLVGIGGLQLARHQFAAALDTAHAAEALGSSRAAQLVEVDALVELGRYDEAATAEGDLIARGQDLSALARASYLREIHGNLVGALAAMQEAADSPALAPENTAYVTTLVGNLLVVNGHRDDARAAYQHALDVLPGYAAAIAGQGRLAVGDGDLKAAIADFQRAGDILPLPEYVIALGDAQTVAGDPDGARDSYDLARLETTLFQSNGVDVDLELGIFETDHGDPANALALAEKAYANRHTFRTADGLAWALRKAGRIPEARERSQEALKVGTRDPLVLYHAGMIASSVGDTVEARRLLGEALTLDPGFSATGAAAARDELARLQPTP